MAKRFADVPTDDWCRMVQVFYEGGNPVLHGVGFLGGERDDFHGGVPCQVFVAALDTRHRTGMWSTTASEHSAPMSLRTPTAFAWTFVNSPVEMVLAISSVAPTAPSEYDETMDPNAESALTWSGLSSLAMLPTSCRTTDFTSSGDSAAIFERT
ncbi:hypothetical protein ACFO5R_10950 [Halosolutus amylolyticus]|uniref:Uncharacterized protein n=1 Tax=Halosolutus amylolyticus TaxID=2932267 RepID=A0ABD5PPN6_9EURY|nr:hypothetical protein [Halosolutus amylolyticus]